MGVLLLAAAMVLSIFLVVLGLPGLWLMLGAALAYDWLVPASGIGLVTLVVAAALALLGEALEWVLATRYTARYGGSSRAGWGAIAGGIAGAMVGLPVPLVGSVIGAFAGAFVGALALELTIAGATRQSATRVAWGALLGRVAAAVAKTGVGCAMAALILAAALRS
ncbi:MAG TPA: DUF456 domain-containing protein [Gemmatimonadaceae bacterium]|nr:MAG: hypothetical protein ABS52_18845 [Gemmatimonadetes bacterium SCN 70-22]HMN09174.1 DUF456 domain-containing protein [Gemmatimonadaceae bacterium]